MILTTMNGSDNEDILIRHNRPRLRIASEADVAAATGILRAAANRMLAEGKQQWDETYPGEADVRADIADGVGYVLERGDEVIGYAAVVFTGEPAYDELEGKWLTAGKYVVAHRVAVSQQVRGTGMGRLLTLAIEELARAHGVVSFRIDTNFDNFAMLGLLDSLGFVYCGEVKYERGSRRAYEKLL